MTLTLSDDQQDLLLAVLEHELEENVPILLESIREGWDEDARYDASYCGRVAGLILRLECREEEE